MREAIGMISLGCNKNQVDTEQMLYPLVHNGYTMVEEAEDADLLIINTCGFIDAAKEESIQAILEAAELKQRGKVRRVLVTGCLSQRYGEELAKELPEVDGFIGVNQYGDIARIVERVLSGERVQEFSACSRPNGRRVLISPRHSVYIRIAEGCSTGCSYCAIPRIRGGYVSRTMEDILAECQEYVQNGAQELILIAQDTSYYGKDLYGEYRLYDLLTAISRLDAPWIRVLYTYPERIDSRLLALMANTPNIVNYLDMPIQHVDDGVLSAMGRHATEAGIRSLLEEIASYGCFTVRTSLICGFPGETESQHQKLLNFVREGHIHRLGAFAYSQEEGTRAAAFPCQLPEEVKARRAEEVLLAQQQVSLRRNQRRVGTIEQVLVDGYDDTLCLYIGRSQSEAPGVDGEIYLSSERPLAIGQFVDARVIQAEEYDVMSEVLP